MRLFLFLLFSSQVSCFYMGTLVRGSMASMQKARSKPSNPTFQQQRRNYFSFREGRKSEENLERFINTVSSIAEKGIDLRLPLHIVGLNKLRIPLGFLLTLGILNLLLLPPITAGLADVLFISFSTFGRILYLNEENVNTDTLKTDLLSLLGSLVTAGLISPQGFYLPDNRSDSILLLVFICALFSAFLLTPMVLENKTDHDINPSKQLLQKWDEKWRKMNKDRN